MTDNMINAAVTLTGGATGNLDSFEGTDLYDGDVFFTIHNGNIYFHKVNATVGGTENSPILITPDTDAGNKRHVLLGVGAYTYETLFLSISTAIDGSGGASAPAALATISNTGTGKLQGRLFDPTTAEDVRFYWQVPLDIDATYGVLYRVACVASAAAVSSKGLAFDLSGFCIGTGDIIDGAFGTTVNSTKAAFSVDQWDMIHTDWSSTVTITDLTAGEMALLKFARNPGHATDDYASDINVVGIQLKYRRILGLGIA